ncbi:NERD domain-containing protein [Agrococcus sediminis]|uniref:protein kinase domain-containing protein n=1 Tax=Agrococcus sediminis TaxID=2599924 RepID=UPI00381ED4E8
MKAGSPLWRVMGDPAQAQEAEALEKVRSLVPDDGVARAWANVTFTDLDGRLNEVDVLLLTKSGIWVVELKGWHGEIVGDQHEWRHANRRDRNPRHLASLKAKRLASVLKDQCYRAKAPARLVPFIQEAIVLHGRDSKVSLDQFGAESVWSLNGFGVKGLAAGTQLSDLIDATPTNPIDLSRAKQLDALMNAIGLMPRPRTRMIGQYALDSADPLGEGPGWQDFLVTHPQAKTKRRIRLFPYPRGAAKDVRDEVDARARREFRLTDGVMHAGIIGPAELLSTDEGSALVFPYDPHERDLQSYLDDHWQHLTFDERARLVQELAELVRYAHGQRLTHRALSPLSVRVHADSRSAPTLRIRDWDLARRPDFDTSTSTLMSQGLTDIAGAVDQRAAVYLAPETLRGATPASAQTLDVYGCGALAYLLLTGQQPVANIAALQELVAGGSIGLDPRAVMPELPDSLAEVVLEAAAFDEALRPVDVAVFQNAFSDALGQFGAEDQERAEPDLDPLEAVDGQIVGDRFEIVRRRGSGSTGVALEVHDHELVVEHVILKLARDDAAATRLAVEASVLDRLDHARIVKRLDGPVAVGPRQGLVLGDAGAETLADRIRIEGRATIEQLENYGADLFDAVAQLESVGVFHRDIKPSNLAIKPDPGTRKPRLTLFDFSLAEEPLTSIRSGSRHYLDPYLGHGGRNQFDSAAERYSIAATLFELATSEPVWWAQGDAPSGPEDAPVIASSMFDATVANELVAFFTRALAPTASDRHPSLESMRAAWASALSAGASNPAAAESEGLALAAQLETPLDESGLSARALSALSRVHASTVGELLGVPPMRINQIRGLGEERRREIASRLREWRERLVPAPTENEERLAVGRRAVESIAGSTAKKPGEAADDWFRRLQKNGTLKGPTSDLVRWLIDLGGIASLDELTVRMLLEYGSTLSEPRRTDAARSVAKAIVDFDLRTKRPKFTIAALRAEHASLVAHSPDDGDGLSFADAEAHLEALLVLGREVDRMLEVDDVVSSANLREALRMATKTPLPLSHARTAQLAVAVATSARLSSMGEAYRRDLSPARAVELALRGAATRELAPVTIEQRVRARFPSIDAVPSRPALDHAVLTAMPYLAWSSTDEKYRLREESSAAQSQTGASTSLGRTTGVDTDLDARLARSVRDRSALAIVDGRSRVPHRSARVVQAHGATVVDLADVALQALKAEALRRDVKWPLVLAADAEPDGSRARGYLLRLAREAISPVWDSLMRDERPLVLINASVIARLGLVDLIAHTTDLAAERAGARWFLLPKPQSESTPSLDGIPFPFGADGWLDLPAEALVPMSASVVASTPSREDSTP